MGGDHSFSKNRSLYRSWLGDTPALTTEFTTALVSEDSVGQFIETRMTPTWAAGSIPVLTWLPSTETTPTATSNRIAGEIADGDHDRLVEEWATRLSEWVTNGGAGTTRRLYFRPAHEMNGNWFPWSAADSPSTTDEYVEMWRHLYEVFDRTDLNEDTIQWVWSPNTDEIGGIRAEAYYPGDAYVDWVGLDGFNFGDSQWYSEWRTPEEIFEGMLGRVRDLTDKPVGLTEVATSSSYEGDHQPAAKTDWIRELFEFVTENDVRMVSWFNVEKSGADEADWSVFGGQRGTETVTIDGETYNTYESYREVVHSSIAVRGGVDGSDRLTDDQFKGER